MAYFSTDCIAELTSLIEMFGELSLYFQILVFDQIFNYGVKRSVTFFLHSVMQVTLTSNFLCVAKFSI